MAQLAREINQTTDDMADLREGLAARPLSIPSKYFYDDKGAALFDDICDLDVYYPTRTEQRLLERDSARIAEITRAQELVELGSGTARKTRTLIRALLARNGKLRYVPIDISSYALEAAAQMADEMNDLCVDGQLADYTRDLKCVSPKQHCLAAFLGSTIGNFRRDDAVSLLADLSLRLHRRDWFLLGVDLVKSVSVLEAAYNDPQGVTEEFNKNILNAVNRDADGDFAPEDFEHLAFFNEAEDQIEMHLVARRDAKVSLGGLGLQLSIRKDEHILTEISRKFTERSARWLLGDAGFELRHWFPSPDRYFAMALSKVNPSLREDG